MHSYLIFFLISRPKTHFPLTWSSSTLETELSATLALETVDSWNFFDPKFAFGTLLEKILFSSGIWWILLNLNFCFVTILFTSFSSMILRFTAHTEIFETLRAFIPELARRQLKNSCTSWSWALSFDHWINLWLVLFFKLYQLYELKIICDQGFDLLEGKYIIAVSFWAWGSCFVSCNVSL